MDEDFARLHWQECCVDGLSVPGHRLFCKTSSPSAKPTAKLPVSNAWASTSESYCSGNWEADYSIDKIRYGMDLSDCQALCDSMVVACYGIVMIVESDGSQECVTCTGENKILAQGTHRMTFYSKPGNFTFFYIFHDVQ